MVRGYAVANEHIYFNTEGKTHAKHNTEQIICALYYLKSDGGVRQLSEHVIANRTRAAYPGFRETRANR